LDDFDNVANDWEGEEWFPTLELNGKVLGRAIEKAIHRSIGSL
jgi:hypothetical protein